jgi:hypothetical protein
MGGISADALSPAVPRQRMVCASNRQGAPAGLGFDQLPLISTVRPFKG